MYNFRLFNPPESPRFVYRFLVVFCFELFLSGVDLKLGGVMASSSDNKGKGPYVDDHLRQKWREERGSGRARPANPPWEVPTKARRIFSHDLQGPTYHVLDLDSVPVIEHGMLVTFELCTYYEALKREVKMLQEENIRLRLMQECFINPRLLPIPPKE
jgi:hypothetical protein